jgi:hypothetical protein
VPGDAGALDAVASDAVASDAVGAADTDADAGEPDAGEPDAPREPDDSGDSAELGAISEPGPETVVAGEAGSEPPAGETVGAEPGSGLVTVVPGVPRYHEPDCILIRFMPEKDVQTKSIPEAKAANCTPCVACQPED